MFRKMVFVSAALMLGGCTGVSLVAPHKVTLLDSYSVTSSIPWTSISGGNTVTWTDDGDKLQSITFFEPIADGQWIFKTGAGGSSKKLPRFDRAMTPIEIAELVVASYAQAGQANVRASDIRPASVGGTQGFRFNITFTGRSGVDYDGFVVGTVRHERLYLIIYSGAHIHYFEKRKDDAEMVIRTIDFGT